MHSLEPVLRIRDVYTGSRILIFTHPGSKNSNKRGGWKKCVVIPFFVATNFTKLKSILFLKCWRKIFLSVFTELYNFFTQKFVTKLWKIWVWNPSEIRKKPIPDPGVKKALDPESGSATLFGTVDAPYPVPNFRNFNNLMQCSGSGSVSSIDRNRITKNMHSLELCRVPGTKFSRRFLILMTFYLWRMM